MKPVKKIPRKSTYGETGSKRFMEIQKFVAAGCKYAEVESYGISNAKGDKKAYIEKAGYDQIILAHDFGAKIQSFARGGKVYLENLDIEED